MAYFVCLHLLSEVNMMFTGGLQSWFIFIASVGFTFLQADTKGASHTLALLWNRVLSICH